MNLRNYARGKPCMIRIPGWCNREPETTILAHVRMAGISGMGLKAPDLLGAFACSDCHDIVDRRRIISEIPRSLAQLYLLEGVIRTQAYLIEQGILSIGKPKPAHEREPPHCSTCHCEPFPHELLTEAPASMENT